MATKPRVIFEYDEEGDVLYISLGTGEPSYAEEIDDIVLVEKGFYSHQITGFRLIGMRYHAIKEVQLILEEVIPRAIEKERSELESIFAEREKALSKLLGNIGKRLPKEIQAPA